MRYVSRKVAALGRRELAALVVVLSLLALVGAAAAAPPANDAFSAAEALDPASGTLSASTAEATREPGEPRHAGDIGSASVWYSWTPSFTGTAVVETTAQFDSLLAVYSGTSVSALTRLASNDDANDATTDSGLCFQAVAGTTYAIAVDGYGGEKGAFDLDWGELALDTGPCPIQPPTVTGTPAVGQTLTVASDGTWAGTGAITRAWVRCQGEVCRFIAGATGSTYTLTSRDVGTSIRTDVIMSDANGDAESTSDPTAPVAMTATTHQNGRIAFTTERTAQVGNFDVWAVEPDGTGLRQLTTSTGFDSLPAYSPDGAKIAFVKDGDIAVMNADGSGQVDLQQPGNFPFWSPDGSRVGFTSGSTVWVADADGSGEVAVADVPGAIVRDGDWSPDGTRILFSAYPAGATATTFDLYVAPADGSAPATALTPLAPLDQLEGDWSPDGTRIVYTQEPPGQMVDGDLRVVNADGTNDTLLLDGDATHQYEYPEWSPDGTKIAFDVADGFGNWDLRLMDANGTNVTPLDVGGRENTAPSWAQFVAPPPPPPSGGGGGGGDGAGAPELVLSLTNIGTPQAVGDGFVYKVVVSEPPDIQVLANDVTLTIQLPPQVQLVSSKVTRGSGCTGTTTLTCNLGYVTHQIGSEAEITVTVKALGDLVASASVTNIYGDRNPANNSATLTLKVPPQGQEGTGGGSGGGTTGGGTARGVTRVGTSRADRLRGTPGPDVLRGLAGNDTLLGLGGADRLEGGPGADALDGGPGADRLLGGLGTDTIRARDGLRDIVDCGPGRDVAVVDRRDSVRNCEVVRRA